jgi:hypothetical protein
VEQPSYQNFVNDLKFGGLKHEMGERRGFCGGFLGEGERLEYRPFCDLRFVPEASRLREHRSKITEGSLLMSFSYVKQS